MGGHFSPGSPKIRPGGHKGTWIVQTLGWAVKFGTVSACLRHMSPQEEEDTSAQEAAGDYEDRAPSSPGAMPHVRPQVFLSFRQFLSCLLAIHPLALGPDVSFPCQSSGGFGVYSIRKGGTARHDAECLPPQETNHG